MKIVKVQVIIARFGADHIYLETDLPPAVWPYKGSQAVKMEAAAGTGMQYVRDNFPSIPKEVLDLTFVETAAYVPFE